MSGVKKNHSIENVKDNFELLLENISSVLKEVRPKTNISATKLGRIKKELANIDNLNQSTQTKVIEVAIKYNTINEIFLNNVNYNKNDLAKIVEGTSSPDRDSDESYNDHFFELSMAVRFLLALQKTSSKEPKINLDGECDVIVDDILAIECKYIHSAANMAKSIQKARRQIDQRIKDKRAKFGFIALDLTHICSRDRIHEFANDLFLRFVHNYESVTSNGRVSGDLFEKFLDDLDFQKTLSNYITEQVEAAFYSEIATSIELGHNAKAILIQSVNSFSFEYKGETTLISSRAMTYLLNKNLLDHEKQSLKRFIPTLAVGV